MNKATKDNLEKDGFRVGDAKDFVDEVLGGLQEMEPWDLAKHLHIWVDKQNGPYFDEVVRRLRREKAMTDATQEVRNYDWKDYPASWIDGYNACGRDALRAALSAETKG
jgi:hypothetical protein